jgi:hypothetical protein
MAVGRLTRLELYRFVAYISRKFLDKLACSCVVMIKTSLCCRCVSHAEVPAKLHERVPACGDQHPREVSRGSGQSRDRG